MGRLQGSGASVKSVFGLRSGLAQMTEADFAGRRCRYCDKRINTALRPDSVYCSSSCKSSGARGSRGPRKPAAVRVALSEFRGQWASTLERAVAEQGEWIKVRCETAMKAQGLFAIAQSKVGFETYRFGFIVHLRYVGANQ